MVSKLHRATLNLGSNLKPEINLPKAVELLKQVSQVIAISQVWESESVGFAGPNFLNACVICLTDVQVELFKEAVIRPIENTLGRVRAENRNNHYFHYYFYKNC